MHVYVYVHSALCKNRVRYNAIKMTKKSPVVLAGFACFSLSSSFPFFFFFITHHFVNPRSVAAFVIPSSFFPRVPAFGTHVKNISRVIPTKPHYRACQHSCDCIINRYLRRRSNSQDDQRNPRCTEISLFLFPRIATLVVRSRL